MEKIQINLFTLLLCLSKAQDLINPKLANHQQQVAYLALQLADEMHLPLERQRKIFNAALIHDIGALSISERLEILESERNHINDHAFRGAKIIDRYPYLEEEAAILRYHHIPWNNGQGLTYGSETVPVESHIVHLADRVCALLTASHDVLSQIPHIMEEISNKNQLIFEPSMVEALLRLSKKEYIWLDLISAAPVDQVFAIGNYEALVLDIDEVIRLTHIFSRVIDFRSKFTARHSAGVAVTAQKLAELVNFSLIECKMMLIAGFLHDIGKLAIDNEVLEKPAKLNTEEFNQMRSHTYYTYQILSMIPEFATIKVWASYHHEKLNGQGYPFHISAENLTLGSRIMAVADVFTAISENRPYREGMEDQKIKTVLTGMADNHFIDSYLVGLLLNNYETFNQVRIDAQHQAAIAYDDFLNSY